MKKAVILIVAIVAQLVAISGKTPVINAKSHEIVFFTNNDRCYHSSYSCAKHSHQLLVAKENNDTTVYMQTRNGAKKDRIKCILCYGLEK